MVKQPKIIFVMRVFPQEENPPCCLSG